MTSIEFAPRPLPVIPGPISCWDPLTECTLTMAEPSAEPGLFSDYHRGAVASYAKFGVSDALDDDAARCAADTDLFWAMTDMDGQVVGGVRAKGPLVSAEDSHAIVEWAGAEGESAVRAMIEDRVPFGIIEMKAAWLAPSGKGDRHRTKQLARTGFHGMAVLGINFCLATSAAHILEQWRSSGGLIAPIPATPYPDERYQTKMLWWDRRTFATHAEPDQIAAIRFEMAHADRMARSADDRGRRRAS